MWKRRQLQKRRKKSPLRRKTMMTAKKNTARLLVVSQHVRKQLHHAHSGLHLAVGAQSFDHRASLLIRTAVAAAAAVTASAPLIPTAMRAKGNRNAQRQRSAVRRVLRQLRKRRAKRRAKLHLPPHLLLRV